MSTLQQVYTFSLFHLHHVIFTVLSHSVPQRGWTALMWASDSGHTDVVQLLLSSGALVDLQTEVRHNIKYLYLNYSAFNLLMSNNCLC